MNSEAPDHTEVILQYITHVRPADDTTRTSFPALLLLQDAYNTYLNNISFEVAESNFGVSELNGDEVHLAGIAVRNRDLLDFCRRTWKPAGDLEAGGTSFG
jgi:hypothetical protein